MDTLQTIAAALRAEGATLSTAESCTGGLIGHLITNLSGSSEWYVGGAISYSNDLKKQVLGVPAEMLDEHGAVSREVAIAMAEGARRAFGTDYALSVTGIAGPGGGSDGKPVGLTYIGLAGPDGTRVERYVWQGNREENKRSSAHAALSLLAAQLGGHPMKTPAPSAAVQAEFRRDGTLHPTSFFLDGRDHRITDWGRQWQEGGSRHFLVMTGDQRVWELIFESATSHWAVVPRSTGERRA